MKSSRRKHTSEDRRNASDITNRDRLFDLDEDFFRRDPEQDTTDVFKDRRFWNPTREAFRVRITRRDDPRPIRALKRMIRPFQRTSQGRINPYHIDSWVRNPIQTAVCKARQVRKEVLHALSKTGKGKGKRKAPKYNLNSTYECKRRRR